MYKENSAVKQARDCVRHDCCTSTTFVQSCRARGFFRAKVQRTPDARRVVCRPRGARLLAVRSAESKHSPAPWQKREETAIACPRGMGVCASTGVASTPGDPLPPQSWSDVKHMGDPALMVAFVRACIDPTAVTDVGRRQSLVALNASIKDIALHCFKQAEAQRTVSAAGGTTAVLAVMSQYPADAALQQNCLNALAFMAGDDAQRQQAFIGAGGLDQLATALGNHPQKELVQYAGCMFLEKLVQQQVAAVASSSARPAIERVVAAARWHYPEHTIIKKRCAAVQLALGLDVSPTRPLDAQRLEVNQTGYVA